MVGAPRRESAKDGITQITAAHEIHPGKLDPIDKRSLGKATQDAVAEIVGEYPADAPTKAFAAAD